MRFNSNQTLFMSLLRMQIGGEDADVYIRVTPIVHYRHKKFNPRAGLHLCVVGVVHLGQQRAAHSLLEQPSSRHVLTWHAALNEDC